MQSLPRNLGDGLAMPLFRWVTCLQCRCSGTAVRACIRAQQCLISGVATASVLPSPAGTGGDRRAGSFRRYLGPQPRSATGLQASPLRDGSTVAERAHHAGPVPLVRLLTRLSVSGPSGSSDTRHGDRWLAARMAGVTVFTLEWSEAHFNDSLINSSVGEIYVIDLLKTTRSRP